MSPEEFATMLKKLLPSGPAFSVRAGSNLDLLMLALADEYSRCEQRGEDVVAEANPLTTFEMLPDWELTAGLPDDCAPEDQTIEERRGALIGKLTSRGGHAVQEYLDQAAALGLTANVVEDHGFRMGLDGMGDGLGGTDWNFVWHMNIDELPEEHRVAGDDPVVTWRSELLECTVEAMAPAHTYVDFSYPQALILDLTRETLDTSIITFERDGEKTYEDANGLIATAPANAWPVEYRNGVPVGRSVWEARTNNTPNSSDPLSWRGTDSVNAIAATSIISGKVAAQVTGTGVSPGQIYDDTYPATGGQALAYVVAEMMPGVSTSSHIIVADITAGLEVAGINYGWNTDNLTARANTSVFGREILSESGPNGGRLVLFWFHYTMPAGNAASIRVRPTNWANDTSGCIIHHAQAEPAATFNGPPIVTEGATVTRPDEKATIEQLARYFNPNGSTIVVRGKMPPAVNSFAAIAFAYYLDPINRVTFEVNTLGNVSVRNTVDGAVSSVSFGQAEFGADFCVAFTVGDTLSASLNASPAESTASAALPNGGQVFIGHQTGGFQWNAPLAEIHVYPFTVTDAELQSLSALN